MTDSTHTPGPWIWRGKSGSLHRAGDAPYTYGDTVLRPEYEYEIGVDTVVSEADANLIASSPDLLGALKSFLTIAQHCDIKSGVCGCGEEMQGHSDPYSAGHSPTDMADQVVSKAFEAAESAIAKAEGRSCRADGGNDANPCPGVVKVALRRTEETGWLVELRGNRPTWWTLGLDEEPGWTTDSTHALRFARKIDAEAYIADAGWTEAFASEHMWENAS